jgi:N-acetyl-gamma-glutamyl-phosphate reductase
MKSIGIIGARGFVGGELLRLCLAHPDLQVTCVTSESQADQPVVESFPTLDGLTDLRFERFDPARAADRAEAFFLALPDGEAMQMAPALLEAGARIVDISGDFRVRDRVAYEAWYKRTHTSPHLLSEAVYGMPELHPEVRDARLVANPGCYPTAALLALAPLVADGRLDLQSIVIDAKSGVSGAGGRTSMREEFTFTAVNQNLRAYGVVGHRHTAEIEQELSRLAATNDQRPAELQAPSSKLQASEHQEPGARSQEPERSDLAVTFTPHLLPITRGIYVTCYARTLDTPDVGELLARYRDFYYDAPFVQITGETPPEIRHVVGANYCRIGVACDPRTRRVIAMAVIDNLVKGAAGSAVQNMNLILGLDETAGLLGAALCP